MKSLNPKKKSMETNKGIGSYWKERRNIFNNFFIEKISLLKDGINQKYVKEPLAKLRKKMEQKNIKFSLKTVTEKNCIQSHL